MLTFQHISCASGC